MKTNRKYKDGVFTDLFSSKENLLELYNAISGSDYSKETKVEIITLDGVLFAPLKNDLAALIEDRFVVLVEHQSTLSDNIPLRMLLYLAREYEKIVGEETLYKKKQVKIPTPELYVLYNGIDPCPNEKILRLSDAFQVKKDKTMLELEVKQININYGKKNILLKRSETLSGYSLLIYKIREFLAKGKTRDEAITLALQACMEQGVLREYLNQKSSEVFNMLLTEYDQEEAVRVQREEAKEEGREEGREEGKVEGKEEKKVEIAVKLLDILDVKTIAETTGLSIEKVEELRKGWAKDK